MNRRDGLDHPDHVDHLPDVVDPEDVHTVGHEPRHLVAGGLLATEADDVAGTLERSLGLSERDRRIDGEWAALWLARN